MFSLCFTLTLSLFVSIPDARRSTRDGREYRERLFLPNYKSFKIGKSNKNIMKSNFVMQLPIFDTVLGFCGHKYFEYM